MLNVPLFTRLQHGAEIFTNHFNVHFAFEVILMQIYQQIIPLKFHFFSF